MLKHVTEKATPVVNALADGYLSSVNDTAVVDVSSMQNVSLSLNLHSNIPMLDLGGLLTHFNTVVGQKFPGTTIPSIVVGHTAGAKAGTITESANVTTLEYDSTVSQVSDMEALLATSIYLVIIKHGTASNTLSTTADDLASTPLSDANATFSVTLEKTVDGTNWAALATVAQSAFPSTLTNNLAVEKTLSETDGRSTPRIKQVRATLAALDGAAQLSLSAGGLQMDDYR